MRRRQSVPLLDHCWCLAAGNINRKGAVAVIATFFFALNLGFLGISKWFWMGLIAVGALGFSDSISVAIRRTMVQMLAPDQMRGRASSFLTVFAQTTNALGAVIAGAAAALVGASNALSARLCPLRRDYSWESAGRSRNCGIIGRTERPDQVSGVGFQVQPAA